MPFNGWSFRRLFFLFNLKRFIVHHAHHSKFEFQTLQRSCNFSKVALLKLVAFWIGQTFKLQTPSFKSSKVWMLAIVWHDKMWQKSRQKSDFTAFERRRFLQSPSNFNEIHIMDSITRSLNISLKFQTVKIPRQACQRAWHTGVRHRRPSLETASAKVCSSAKLAIRLKFKPIALTCPRGRTESDFLEVLRSFKKLASAPGDFQAIFYRFWVLSKFSGSLRTALCLSDHPFERD